MVEQSFDIDHGREGTKIRRACRRSIPSLPRPSDIRDIRPCRGTGASRDTERMDRPARPAREPRRAPAFGAALALIAAAWLPALAAALVVLGTGGPWSNTLRVIVTALVYAPVAAVVIVRGRPAIALVVGALAVQCGWLALAVAVLPLTEPGTVPAALADAVLLFPRLAEVAALCLLPLLLARRRDRLWRAGIAAGIVVVALDATLSLYSRLVEPLPLGVLLVVFYASIGLFVVGTAMLVGEGRAGGPRERAALTWLAVGAALLVAGYLRIAIPLGPTATVLSDAAFVLAQAALPAAVLAVALRGRRIGEHRHLAAGALRVQAVAVSIAAYLLISHLAGLLGASTAVAGAIAAGALALCWVPLMRSLRRRTAELYGQSRDDARAVLRRIGAHLAGGGGLTPLAAALRSAWGLQSVELVPDSGAPPAREGSAGAAAVEIELTAGGVRVGRLVLTSADPAYLRTEIAPVVTEIAGLIAVAVVLADLNIEVAETRERMLEVRREERRMLHRELHDELAPSLAGIGFGMAAAGRLIESGSPRAGTALADVRDDVARRAEDVRRLARSLLPAALDEGDLEGALQELARRFAVDGVRIDVRAAGADVLDADLQVACYLAATEAVVGMRRTAGVAVIGVAVEVASASVTLLVTGDRVDPAVLPALADDVARRARDVGARVRVTPGRRGVEAVMPR